MFKSIRIYLGLKFVLWGN